MSVIPSPQRFWRTALQAPGAGAALTSGTAYFTYVGFVAFPVTINYARFHVQTAGSGGQTAECGLFSSPTPPNRAGITLTKIVATGVVDSLTAAGPITRANTVPFAQVIPAGTYLWTGLRIAMVTTQPLILGINGDGLQGTLQVVAGSGVLTGAGPFVGAVPTTAVGGGAYNVSAPGGCDIWATID